MVEHVAATVVIHDTPLFFGPDTTRERRVTVELEAAGNHHTGAGQGVKSERDVSLQNVECWEDKNHSTLIVW